MIKAGDVVTLCILAIFKENDSFPTSVSYGSNIKL